MPLISLYLQVVDNMKRMKGNHVKVVEKIQDQYKAIEEHTQVFNYILRIQITKVQNKSMENNFILCSAECFKKRNPARI